MSTVDELRSVLADDRRRTVERVRGWLADAPGQPVELTEEERLLDLRLSTIRGAGLGGQVVTDGDRLVYASLYARQDAPQPV